MVWHSPAAPNVGALAFRAKIKNNNFPVTLKIRTSGYQTLECIVTYTFFTSNHNSQLFMLYGRLVDVSETFNRFADFGL